MAAYSLNGTHRRTTSLEDEDVGSVLGPLGRLTNWTLVSALVSHARYFHIYPTRPRPLGQQKTELDRTGQHRDGPWSEHPTGSEVTTVLSSISSHSLRYYEYIEQANSRKLKTFSC